MRLLDCFSCITFLLPLHIFSSSNADRNLCMHLPQNIYIYIQFKILKICISSGSHFLQKFSLKLWPLRNSWLLYCWFQQSQDLYLKYLGQNICFRWNFHHWVILHTHCPDACGDFAKVCMGHLNFRLDFLQAVIKKSEV